MAVSCSSPGTSGFEVPFFKGENEDNNDPIINLFIVE